MTFQSQSAIFMALLRQQRLRLAFLLIGVLAPLYVFGELAEDVVEKEPFAFDGRILEFFHGHATPSFDAAMSFMSWAGSVVFLIPFDLTIALILLSRKRWWSLVFWGLSIVGAGLLNVVAKHSFARPRPDLWPSVATGETFSFPSGHAMHTMAVCAAIVILAWHTPWRWPSIILGMVFVLAVGCSRVYLGVHFPSDVLAGWSASVAWVLGLHGLLFKNLTRPELQHRPST